MGASWGRGRVFMDPLQENFPSARFKHQSLDIMVSYHHVQYQKKLMIQSWENLVTDGRTTDENDFIGRCPTNVERPIWVKSESVLEFNFELYVN